jgi:hypothetical protein
MVCGGTGGQQVQTPVKPGCVLVCIADDLDKGFVLADGWYRESEETG